MNEIYPALRRYVDQVREQSIQDGFNFPAVTATLLLQGGGGFLEKPDLHPVVLNGIEWPAVLKEAIPDQQVSFTYAFGDQNGLLTDRPFDPDLARQLVDRNSLGQNALSLLVQEGDPTLERMVRLLTVRFKELGIPLEIGFVPAADLQPKYQATIASGIPALALSWR